MAARVKGMVQVQGTTYRISGNRKGTYTVVRIIDDVLVGRFMTFGQAIEMEPHGVEMATMKQIVRQAVVDVEPPTAA
jgi:hypothetical protein